MTTLDPLDHGQLADYEIVGELSGREDAKVLLATRREDQRPVLITVARKPARDRGNALSHLAADANLLAATPHPHVLRVLEARWIGTDALAVVTDRPSAPTLEEMLTRRAEEFPYARVAAVLRDVNAALEWARGQQVVHRGLRLDTVVVEPGSDDVQVTFAMTALPATGMPGADADARTIASLARAMLTRSVMDPRRDRLPLAELRPGLPARVVEQTDALLVASGDAGDLPDVSGYIATIAMAEDLKRAEVERENVRREIEAEQQRTRAELAAEREAHDKDLAEQARRFAEERERDRQAMDRQRKKDEKEIARRRDGLEKERRQLERERESFARERADFERESAVLRAKISRRLAAIEEQASLYAATSELPAMNHDVMGVTTDEPVVASGTTPLVDHGLDAPPDPYDELVDEDDEETRLSVAAAADTAPSPAFSTWADRVGRSHALRNVSAALLILVILVGATAVALSRRGHEARVASRAPLGRVLDSMAGTVVSPAAAVDSSQLAPAATLPAQQPPATIAEAPVRHAPRRTVQTPPAQAAPAAPDSAPANPLQSAMERQVASPGSSPVVPRQDSVRPLPFTRPDSARPDSAARARLDSLPKVVMPKLDSLLPRRDTTPAPATP